MKRLYTYPSEGESFRAFKANEQPTAAGAPQVCPHRSAPTSQYLRQSRPLHVPAWVGPEWNFIFRLGLTTTCLPPTIMLTSVPRQRYEKEGLLNTLTKDAVKLRSTEACFLLCWILSNCHLSYSLFLFIAINGLFNWLFLTIQVISEFMIIPRNSVSNSIYESTRIHHHFAKVNNQQAQAHE